MWMSLVSGLKITNNHRNTAKLKETTRMANRTITAPKGFLATGLHCGVKRSGKPDLALLYCPTGAKAAAVFTTNAIEAAP